MATGPKVATTPLEALDNNRDFKEPFLVTYLGPIIGGAVGITSIAFTQWALKRPLVSGIQRYIVASVALGTIGHYVHQYRRGYLAERDAMFRHYMELHPDDFPPFKRAKYGDILEPWIPIR